MAFGAYVHIPYCLQRCTYCDFATYEKSKILPSEDYVDLVIEEISQTRRYQPSQPLDTLYFGGGTPSLLPASQIVALIDALEKAGYPQRDGCETTIEINPATIDREKMKVYLDRGINRFSVGAQTFDDRLLKSVKREHSARQTLETLELLQSLDVNFSFDLLFALPGQTLAGVAEDLRIAVSMGSAHVSPYCLTVPEGHSLSAGRPPEEEQVAMFEVIEGELGSAGFDRYEISNFARPGRESRHNLLYWTDQEYWALGLGAHGYSKASPWGTRYWNENAIGEYTKRIAAFKGQEFESPRQHRPEATFELLAEHQALTDFCHTSLRLSRGLEFARLRERFDDVVCAEVTRRLSRLTERGWVDSAAGHFRLTPKGLLVSNRVFEEMTFLEHEMPLRQG